MSTNAIRWCTGVGLALTVVIGCSSASDGGQPPASETTNSVDAGTEAAPPAPPAPTCTDHAKNGDETDVDCGGTCAPTTTCGDGKSCSAAADCTSGVCTGGVCAAATCTDVVANGDETDVDCGGTCAPAKKCADSKKCAAAADCTSGVCTSGTCVAATCADGVENGDETDQDCGGTCAPAKKCADAKKCLAATDCTSGVCTGGLCIAPACNDGVANGGETDVDCGGTCAATNKCAVAMKCAAAGDCASGVCSGGACIAASATFTASGNFVVPAGVTSLRVLAVGGGGGGANGHQGGGGSGYVSEATVAVTPGATIPVTVGAGGTGANTCSGCNTIVGNTPGGASSFGALLSAAGGLTVTTINAPAANGGSGGGGSCNSGSVGGAGGTNGGNGASCTYQGGTGQGSFAPLFVPMVRATLSAGTGGAGGGGTNAGGGGGGGVLIDGAGPTASDGIAAFSAKGGKGYGAGGGSGGFNSAVNNDRPAGGNGAAGVVYIEIVAP